MLSGHQRIKRRRNIAENFNRLSRVHERYRQTTDDRQTDDRQTDGRRHIANINMSSRSLKMARVSRQSNWILVFVIDRPILTMSNWGKQEIMHIARV